MSFHTLTLLKWFKLKNWNQPSFLNDCVQMKQKFSVCDMVFYAAMDSVINILFWFYLLVVHI